MFRHNNVRASVSLVKAIKDHWISQAQREVVLLLVVL
jgi:hypothetical protein